MNDDLPTNLKTRSRKKSQGIISSLYQGNELFFGDPILGMIEQVIAESSGSATSVSIDNPSIDNYTTKEWSTLCLKAKHTYLRELKNLQKSFVSSLEEASLKYINREQNIELGQQIKGYVNTEFQKIDNIQQKISEHIRKVSPHSLKDLLTEKLETQDSEKKSDEWLPKDQYGEISHLTTQNDTKDLSVNTNLQQSHYNEVLERLEKKYDEIYNLVTQSFIKGKDESFDMTNAGVNFFILLNILFLI